MRLLCIDTCPRDQALSRTFRLLGAFQQAYRALHPTNEIHTLRLAEEGLAPFFHNDILHRERLVDEGRLDDAMFRWARDFQNADHIAVAAPYWDLSFPAVLKLYIENIYVRNLTFRYTVEGEPVGLCRGQRLLYLTTAGSPIGNEDWGYGYIRAVAKMLGVKEVDRVSAEGLDIAGWDAQGILDKAMKEARQAAHAFKR